jgi:hypothetical protein
MIGIYDDVAHCGACMTYGTDNTAELAERLALLSSDYVSLQSMSKAAIQWAGHHRWTDIIRTYLPQLEVI